MYTIALPLLGFEKYKKLEIKIIDKMFSTLMLDKASNLQITIVNIDFFVKMNLNFTIEDEILEKLHIDEKEDFDIYFCLVKQEPIEESIVNIIAPILINKKDKILGQYIIKDKVPRLFVTLNSNI